MTKHRIHITADDQQLTTEADETKTVLEAMASTGLPVRKACRNGVCSLCRCRLVSGEITYHWKKPHGLWDKHIAEGFILPCIAFPLSDLALDNLILDKKPQK